MKILVVGSKGFIGSHVEKFLHSIYEVWGCDIFTDYNESNFILINPLQNDFAPVFSKYQFDVCVNCAGAASVLDSVNNPTRDYELNTHLVFLLLEGIRKGHPSCKFINLSSAAVYGNPENLPVNETHPLNPISPYGVHKKQAEEICREYFKFFQVKTCSLRIFSAYGPGLRKQILWDLHMKCKTGSAIELFGTGQETRDYLFVEDICSAIECVIRFSDFDAVIYNLGSGVETSLIHLCQLFIKEIKWRGNIKFTQSKRTGDPDHWKADIGKIKTLGFAPQIALENGVKKYVEWLQSLA